MNSKELALKFRIANIKTLEFAILEENYEESTEVGLSTALQFGFDDENHAIGVDVTFKFMHNEQSFLVISARCGFEINEEAFDSFKSENTITVPKGFASHLAVITVGTTRGILHEKTNNTPFNDFIIPTINLTEFIKEDIVLDLDITDE